MQSDLFVSKKEQLYNWMKQKKYIKTSDVALWGTQNHCNRAMRNARILAEEGKIKRMDEWLKISIYGSTKGQAWVVV